MLADVWCVCDVRALLVTYGVCAVWCVCDVTRVSGYYFCIAFENSRHVDYVTEKMFQVSVWCSSCLCVRVLCVGVLSHASVRVAGVLQVSCRTLACLCVSCVWVLVGG